MDYKFKILDCTLRDGGYYTNWDFSDECVTTYLNAIENLPIDYIEVGYRSKQLKGYFGEYFYLPEYVMQYIHQNTSKKITIILNEKDVRDTDAEQLLTVCKPYIHTVRLAVDPQNFERALQLAKSVKDLGFQVCFNLMYMSNWTEYPNLISRFSALGDVVDVLYMVDSYGGVYPEDVRKTYKLIKENTSIKIGFHGHNNLELGLINTLTAVECGVDFIDATITGMGRGAGNLKTELLLTVLENKKYFSFDYNALSKVVDEFTILQKKYEWGSNLPYMVSGANSLPQKNVMEWMSKKHYSINSIIRALKNEDSKTQDSALKTLDIESNSNKRDILIVGGGNSVVENFEAVKLYLVNNRDTVIVHSSPKNAIYFKSLPNKQYFCLIGNEGLRLENLFKTEDDVNGIGVLPPFPRKMGTYIPKMMEGKAYELKNLSLFEDFEATHTSIALQLAFILEPNNLYIVGYDGYASSSIDTTQQELFIENTEFFKFFQAKTGIDLVALTTTKYKILRRESIFGKV